MASSLDNVDHARIVPASLPIEPMTRARTRRPATFGTFGQVEGATLLRHGPLLTGSPGREKLPQKGASQ